MKPNRTKILILFLLFSAIVTRAQVSDSLTMINYPEYTSLAEALKNPDKVYKLSLRKNKLKEIPPEIFTLKNLKELDLSRNKLTSIPKEISKLTNLEILDVSANEIDTLYPEIGLLTNIKKLILNQNLIAHLPKSISNLKKMYFLDLWGNEIQQFPDEIAKLKKTLKIIDMRVINIHDNQQEELVKLLPDTKFFFSYSCNCN
jgi:Leucine-rich repeat (LRR) protein